MSKQLRIVIIGNGVAGIRCALTARERDRKASITVISGETEYFFSRTALMYAFMDKLSRKDLEPHERKMYRKQRIDLVRDWVVDLDPDKGQVHLESGKKLDYDRLVFAVGARPNMFPWTGADKVKDGLVHFVSMQDLDNCERLAKTAKRAVVVGGGLIGIELVECLRWHGIEVDFLIRENWYWPMALGKEESTFVREHMEEHGVHVHLEEEIKEILTNEQGQVTGIETNQGNRRECQILGICAGVRPNVDRLKNFATAPEIGRGIVVDQFLETSIPGVFAAGDCAEIHLPEKKPFIDQIWYTARDQGNLVGQNLFGDKISYQKPIFYNSSKFFEIEYTTVGEIMLLPEGTPSIYRKTPGKPVSQRILHDKEKVLGFNMLGSRWNHEVLQRWIGERRSPEYCLENLSQAQFDVEFGRAALQKMDQKDMPLEKEKSLK